jgi:hypothetical protein
MALISYAIFKSAIDSIKWRERNICLVEHIKVVLGEKKNQMQTLHVSKWTKIVFPFTCETMTTYMIVISMKRKMSRT